MADEKQNVTFSLPESLLRDIDELAEDETRNRSNMVAVLLREAIESRASLSKSGSRK
jgi:metal-responsive CopG/Arc/MetJ family transcriptional regulator